MEQTYLTTDELDQVLKLVSPTGRDYSAGRVCRLLARHPATRTRVINRECAVGNISDIVGKAINPRIESLGLYVACVQPPMRLRNRFGEPSGEMLWSFFRDYAANDPVFDDNDMAEDLASDLDDIQAEYPDLDRWEHAAQHVTRSQT